MPRYQDLFGLVGLAAVLSTGCITGTIPEAAETGSVGSHDAKEADVGSSVDGPAPDAGLPMVDTGLPMPDSGLPVDDGGLPVDDGGLPVDDGGLPVDDGGLPGDDGGIHPTFFVQGTELYDPCGERVVLRGVNAGNAFPFPSDTESENLDEVGQTGANAARITYLIFAQDDGRRISGPEELEAGLTQAIANGMVAMPAVWDATGNWSELETAIQFWTSPEVVTVLRRHERYTFLNIANEGGDGSVSNQQFREGYADAIRRIRQAGLRMPLVIDAANWGREEGYIIDNGNYLLQQDPERNLVFSWHPWDPDEPQSRYTDAMDAVLDADLCMIIGEFSHVGVFFTEPIDYRYIMASAQARGIGWLYWWWWSPEDPHSMTEDNVYGHWTPVGEEIAITGTHSIRNTSVRTRFLINRGQSCD